MTTLYREPLSRHTTFRIGGPARVLAQPSNEEELRELLETLGAGEEPWLVIGAGSNILFDDRGFPGTVIRTGGLSRLETRGNSIFCGAGVPLARLLGFAISRSLGGLEYLAGIPGTVGGALAGNAGTGEKWISSSLSKVSVISHDWSKKSMMSGKIDFGYRFSPLACYPAITGALFKTGGNCEKGYLKKSIASAVRCRARKQPRARGCAGSIFRNPPGDYAGRLLEAAGCKGLRRGDAIVSEKHANFILNTGRASARDVLYLIEKSREKVSVAFGVDLELEVKIISGKEHFSSRIQAPPP